MHTVRNTRIHRRSARKHDITIEVTTDVEIAFVDGIVPALTWCEIASIYTCSIDSRCLVDTRRFKTKERWLEESLRSTESEEGISLTAILTNMTQYIPLVANGDDLSIRKLVALLKSR